MQVLRYAMLCGLIPLILAGPLSAQLVVINEILYDTPGDDNPSQLFTELWGTPGTSLSGWTLVGTQGSTGEDYVTIHLSGTIPDDGYYVIANLADSAYVDLNLDLGSGEGVDWANAGGLSGDDCDGVELRRDVAVIDRVCYGNCAPGHICSGEGDTNAPDAYPVGELSYAIARCPDHGDTDNNSADWVIAQPTPGRLNQCSCQPQGYTLEQIQEDETDGTPVYMGEFVSLRGIATVAGFTFNPQEVDFYIQDNTAGVNVLNTLDPVAVTVGDCVMVEGWISQSSGLCQIVSSGSDPCVPIIEVMNRSSIPAPVVLDCRTARVSGEQYEGMLVKLECVTIIGGDPWPSDGQDADITVIDGTGLFTIHLDKDTDIDGRPEPDSPITFVGILSQRDSTSPFTENYYLLPRAWSDITPCVSTDNLRVPHWPDLQLTGCQPNPFNTSIRISFTVAHPTRVSVSIFDLLGRQVMKGSVVASSAGEYSYTWDGRNSTGQMLGTGLYFVRLRAGSRIATAKLLFLK